MLHYLDKMEYRPTPKSRSKVVLKRRPDSQEITTNTEDADNTILPISDKRQSTGFNRVIIKEFERILGVVQEKKSRKEGEPVKVPGDIYVEPFKELVEEIPLPNTHAEEREENEEKESEKPENKEFEEEPLPDEPKETEQEEPEEEPLPKEQEEPAQKLPKKKRVTKPVEIPPVKIDQNTKLEGVPVLSRVPQRPSLDKLVVKAPAYYMANRKLYLQNISKLFSKFSKELLDDKTPVSCDNRGASAKDFDLLIHQRIVREYLNVYTPYRGLLLYHGLGSGKTCTSIAIAEAAKTHKRIFVMTPASLKMNFFSELKKCGDSLYKKNQYWEFISTEGRPEYVSILSQILSIKPEWILKNRGAWLVDIRKTEPNYSDLSPENQNSLDEQLNAMIRSKYVDINYNGLTESNFKKFETEYGSKNATKNPFDHSVVLVDEAHNLVSRIVNHIGDKKPGDKDKKEKDKKEQKQKDQEKEGEEGQKAKKDGDDEGKAKRTKKEPIAARLYEYLMSATDVKIVFMSGTPIINYPNEMAVMFNMLRGYINTWKFTIPTTTGLKLTSEKILKMFHDAGFKTYDYIDYSNETLSITRNPFGFINVDAASIAKKIGVNVPVPKTKVVGTKVSGTKVSGGNKNTKEDSQSDSESEEDPAAPKPLDKTNNRHTPKKHKGTSSRKSAKNHTAKKIVPHYQKKEDSDGEIEIKNAEYKLNKGAIELPKSDIDELSSSMSDNTRAQIELEIHQSRNAVGEDPYHGGAPVVDERYSGVRLDEQGNLSDIDFERRVKEILTQNDIAFLPTVVCEKYKSLPDTKTDFAEIFINMNTLQVQRADVLKKRVLGLTSYFRSAQESLLPKFILSTDTAAINPQYHVEYVEMSDQQFVDYAKERNLEMKREPKNKKPMADANKDVLKVSGSYRTFTRAKCNFSFPDEIPRPMPPSFNPDKNIAANELDNINDDNELDVGDLGDNAEVPQISSEYDRSINKALADLKAGAQQYLSPEGLKQCSPKFAKILENLQDAENRGLHLVYSSFRTLEGIGILKLVLEANGFAEFKLKKTGDTWSIVESEDPADKAKPRFVLYTGTETAEEKEIIRNVYNSNWEFVPATIVERLREINANNYYGEIIKILMITSSGAEGINLENTRFVHIVEPYWHMVRVDQVVGRARRICSHKNLPEELRTIKVFLYMCKFSEKQKFSGDNVAIMNRDTSRLKTAPKGAKLGETAITTDETLFEIAVIKDRLTKQLLQSVKESSVDCSVYDNSKEGLVCYTYGYSTSNEFGSFPTYEEDRYVREGTDVVKKTADIERKVVRGKLYAHNTETDDLYNLEEYAKNGRVVIEGNMRDFR